MRTLMILLCLSGVALADYKGVGGDVPVELPPEIQECTTDVDCEDQAELLCERGYLEWCSILS